MEQFQIVRSKWLDAMRTANKVEGLTLDIAVNNTLGTLIVEGYREGDTALNSRAQGALMQWFDAYAETAWEMLGERIRMARLEPDPFVWKLATEAMSDFLLEQAGNFDTLLKEHNARSRIAAAAVAALDTRRAANHALEKLGRQMKDELHRAELAPRSPEAPQRLIVFHGRDRAALSCVTTVLDIIRVPYTTFAGVEKDAKIGGQSYVHQVVEAVENQANAAVIVLTPDEFARLEPQHWRPDDTEHDRQRKQTRPNVLLEYGLAIGWFKNERTLPVLFGGCRLPSDFSGLNELRWQDGISGARNIASKLEQMGYSPDLSDEVRLKRVRYEATVPDAAIAKPPFDGIDADRLDYLAVPLTGQLASSIIESYEAAGCRVCRPSPDEESELRFQGYRNVIWPNSEGRLCRVCSTCRDRRDHVWMWTRKSDGR